MSWHISCVNSYMKFYIISNRLPVKVTKEDESDVFSGIVCCSGSLWFPDWDHYVRNHVIQSKCSVYLSLGGKEEKAKNKVMAAVGDRTSTG